MKISWVKYAKDKESFKIPENLGLDVIKLTDLEQTDNVLKNLKENNYRTVVLSNEVASFSSDIISKYSKDENINIIISPSKR